MNDSPIIFDDLAELSSCNKSLYDCGYIPGSIDDSDIEFINFSGGGMAGAAFAGSLAELEKRRNLKDIKYWIGSSAGAICSAFGVLGANSDYVKEQLLNTDTRIFLDYGGRSQNNDGWWNTFLNYRYGISELISRLGTARGNKFNEWFRTQIANLGWNPDITFADLYDVTGKHLVVTATSINTYETLWLSRSSYPYMKVSDAVHVSMILPFLFQPVSMKDPLVIQGKRLLVDGGILDNLPINACDLSSDTGEILAFNRKAIGFTLVSNGKWSPPYVNIDGPYDPSLTRLMKYFLTFVRSMHTRLDIIQSHQPYYWDRVVPIETYDIDTLDFGANKTQIQKIIDSGQRSTKVFLDKRDEIIKKHGPLPRNLFIPNDRLRYNKIEYLSDDLIEDTNIYQTNPEKFSLNHLPPDVLS